MGNQNGIDSIETPFGEKKTLAQKGKCKCPCLQLGYWAPEEQTLLPVDCRTQLDWQLDSTPRA